MFRMVTDGRDDLQESLTSNDFEPQGTRLCGRNLWYANLGIPESAFRRINAWSAIREPAMLTGMTEDNWGWWWRYSARYGRGAVTRAE